MLEIKFKVNGVSRHLVVEPGRRLLDILRDDLGLTGAKQSCDRKGQCGACTVILNGKAVRSCLVKARELAGAEVISVEGLGTPDNPHFIQEAFVLAGAVQCGFCTPGMIMAAKALLDSNPDPGVEEIKGAFKRNLCRCTGYGRIIEAVQLAGRFIRGEISPDEVRPDPAKGVLGVSLPRPGALDKACGRAVYTADLKLPGALELAVVRVEEAPARILRLDVKKALASPGVVDVITAADIKGTNRIKASVADQPLLCDELVRVVGDPVAIVAARTREEALAAAKLVEVSLLPIPAVRNLEEALAPGAPRVHADSPNRCFEQPLLKGDAEAALAGSAQVVEAEFSTQMIHQAPLEPEAAAAWVEEAPGGGMRLAVAGRGINIHHHAMVISEALGVEEVRYLEMVTGGQFGIKLDVTAEGIAAAAAWKLGRPVRYVSGLTETLRLTTKRHPMKMRLRLGADGEGRITGLHCDYDFENGAYTSWGRAVVLRSVQMLSGAYHIPHVKARAGLVYSNNAWGGAARGAGPPQANFCLESALDMLARKLGLDPLEMRAINTLKPGQTICTGQEAVIWPFPGCLEAVRPHYERARNDARAGGGGNLKRGVGLAGASFGIGKAAGGDRASVAVELLPDGGLAIYGSVADPGEGNDSMLTQLAAHVMGVPPEKVRLFTRDSSLTPDTSSASGSRMTYMGGGALLDAIRQLKEAMAETGAGMAAELEAPGKPLRYLGVKVQNTVSLDPVTGQGVPYEERVHGVQMAEVEVDTNSGEVRVLKMTAVVDPGVIINPLNVIAQLEGGMDMGLGMALREEYILGRTNDWVSYPFPTMATSVSMEVILLETPRPLGPLGATGVGEFVLLPTAAAVMNAIEDATGARVRDLPARPERVLAALRG